MGRQLGDPVATWPGSDGSTGAPSFRPYGLAGRPWERVALGVLTLALVIIFAADLAAPAPIEITALALVAVIAAAWLMSTIPAVLVAASAIALAAADAFAGGVPPESAAVEAAVFCVVAISSRFYASRLRIVLEGTDTDQASIASSVFGLENLAHLVDASADGVAAVDLEGRVRYANAAAMRLLNLPAEPERQPTLVDFIVPEDRSRVMSELASAPVDGGATLGFRVRGENGELRDLECRHTHFWMRRRTIDGLVIRDMTEIKRLQLAASVLAETAANLAVTQPLELIFEVVARRVVEVSQACACAVLLLEGDSGLKIAGSWGLPDGYAAGLLAASQSGSDLPALEAIRTKAPVFEEDLLERIRTETQFAPIRPAVNSVPWRLAVAVPMIHNGRPVGALAVYFHAGQRPDDPTLNFMSAIAGQAASAAQVSRLVAAAQDQVAAEERHRLSRELHDSLTQELYGIMLGAKSARARLTNQTTPLVEPLDYILELAEAGLADMRRLVLELRPETLEKEGLIAALNQCADAISARHGLEVIKQLPQEPDELPLNVKLVAYRVVQEALHNVVKHAHAKRAWLRAALEVNTLAIEVSDDGSGFDSRATYPGHFGLASMRERAVGLGGTLTFGSSPTGGTSVQLRLPIRSESRIPVGAS